jgi:hypothetical protein
MSYRKKIDIILSWAVILITMLMMLYRMPSAVYQRDCLCSASEIIRAAAI